MTYIYRKTWLEARIVTSRVSGSIDEEDACRQIAKRQNTVLDEDAIKREVIARKTAGRRWQAILARLKDGRQGNGEYPKEAGQENDVRLRSRNRPAAST